MRLRLEFSNSNLENYLMRIIFHFNIFLVKKCINMFGMKVIGMIEITRRLRQHMYDCFTVAKSHGISLYLIVAPGNLSTYKTTLWPKDLCIFSHDL